MINHSGNLKSLKNVSLGSKSFIVLAPCMLRHGETGMVSHKLHGFLIYAFVPPVNHWHRLSVIFSDSFVKVICLEENYKIIKKTPFFSFMSFPFSIWKLRCILLYYLCFLTGKFSKPWNFYSTLSVAICQRTLTREMHSWAYSARGTCKAGKYYFIPDGKRTKEGIYMQIIDIGSSSSK